MTAHKPTSGFGRHVARLLALCSLLLLLSMATLSTAAGAAFAAVEPGPIVAPGRGDPRAARRPPQELPHPRDLVGREIGADRQVFGWQTILDALARMDEASDRIELRELGKTTQGRPFVLVTVGDAEGVAAAARYRALVRRLYDVTHTEEQEARSLARTGRAIVALSLNIHSTEIASSQESLELIWELASREDPLAQRIRASTIVLIIPSMNPDGLDIVTDWYHQTLGTEAEGSSPPWLYHHYAGHDNNRDAFFNNLAETRLWSKVLYEDWLPQVILDQHQMGSSGPRLFLPPFDDPLSPTVHPLVYSQIAAAGQQMVSDLTARGWTGLATSSVFTAEWPGSVRSTGFWHNMLGLLSEAASVRIATPLYFPPASLRPFGRGVPRYERRANFLEPWPGGWWHLRNIIDMEKDLTWSLLRWVADHREDLLWNFQAMNRDAVEKGRREPPYGFLIPRRQHDHGSARRLVDRLLRLGIEVGWVEGRIECDGRLFPGGAYLVSAAQPFRPMLLEMMGESSYPMVEDPARNGPIRPYDATSWHLPALLGVTVHPLEARWTGRAARPVVLAGAGFTLGPDSPYLLLSADDNASYAAAAAALGKGMEVRRWLGSEEPAGAGLAPAAACRPGDFLIHGSAAELGVLLADAAAETRAVSGDVWQRAHRVRPARLGLYAPWGGSMDEGWTRLVLDRAGLGYQRMRAADLTGGESPKGDAGEAEETDPASAPEKLGDRLDVLLLPSIDSSTLAKGRQPSEAPDAYSPRWPPEYRGGLGERATGERLRSFVEGGGTLIALDRSTRWVIENLGLPVREKLGGLEAGSFVAPGTLVRAIVDRSSPLCWGMPAEVAVYVAGGEAFTPLAWQRPTAVPVRYARERLRISGFLQGGEMIAGLPAMVAVPLGKGQIVLFGFRPQNRAQTEVTFKLLFNALFLVDD